MSVITTISSSIVKPRSPRAGSWDEVFMALPVPVLGAVERGAVEGRVDVEDVLPAPVRRVGPVLIRAQSPLGLVRHRIDGNPAEEFQLAAGGVVGGVDAVDERLQIRRIVLAADLELERSDLAEIGGVLVL